jgi:thioredoxin-related protein
MRIFLYPLLVAAFVIHSGAYGGGKEKLKWMSFNEGVAVAKKSGKKVMVDVYTDWCGWCKRMDRDTYSDGTIADYLSKNYVAVKLNAESAGKLDYKGHSYTERELAAAFGVNGYPSIIFLTQDGEPITVYPGYADPQKFKTVLSYIAEDYYKTTKFQDYVENRK